MATEAEIIKLDALGAGMCSWPEGEPGTDAFRFCGRPAVAGKPYCGEHCARAYVKSSRAPARPANAPDSVNEPILCRSTLTPDA